MKNKHFVVAIIISIIVLAIGLLMIFSTNQPVFKWGSQNVGQTFNQGSPQIDSLSSITGVRSWLSEQQLYANISANLILHETQIQTLKTGIPLTFIIEIKISREKKILFDKTIINQKLKFQLEYHALSNQYIVTNLNEMSNIKKNLQTKLKTDSTTATLSKKELEKEALEIKALEQQELIAKKSFPTLSLALNFMSHLKRIPIGLADTIKPDQSHQGSVQIWLDIEALPTPMQLPAFFDPNWAIQTDIFNWEVFNSDEALELETI